MSWPRRNWKQDYFKILNVWARSADEQEIGAVFLEKLAKAKTMPAVKKLLHEYKKAISKYRNKELNR